MNYPGNLLNKINNSLRREEYKKKLSILTFAYCMSVEDLLEMYSNTPRLFQIADRISYASPQKVHLCNLNGSSAQFVVSAIFEHPSCTSFNHLIVLNDPEEAAWFHNTLESLTDALDLFYFPSSFRQNKKPGLVNSSHVMLRTETLARIATPFNKEGTVNKKMLVTYPEALLEKVVVPDLISSGMIHMMTGEFLDTDEVLLKLSDLGFERTDFVYEPGQFAIRGGILDIYSFGNDKPYRFELFGKEVESIRIIDPETQLSERKLMRVSIIPDIQKQYHAENKVSLFDFLPENTVVWLEDKGVIMERLRRYEKDLDQIMNTSGFREIIPKPEKNSGKNRGLADEQREAEVRLNPEEFITSQDFEAGLEQRHVISFSKSKSGPENEKGQDTDIVLEFSTSEQPSFNRRFDWLIFDLQEWEKKGYRIFIFAENPKQLERLYSIFSDLKAEIVFTPVPVAIHEGFIDDDLKIVCYTDHQVFQRYHKYRIRQAYNKNRALTLRSLRELQPGDFITHIDHGVGIFSGLQKIEINGKLQEAVRLLYRDNDILYVNINSLHKIAKFSGKEGSVPKINKLGSDVWNRLKDKTKAKVKEIAFDLIKLYAKRKAKKGFQHSPDNYLQTELEASFIYEDTPDQGRATSDVKKDMESPAPMDRLICGDVGFGKTEIAIRSAFKTCLDGKQAAVLVPTTILAFQHYQTFRERLKDFPVTVDYINRFKSPKQKKETLKKLGEGKLEIIIGTHALLGKDVKFKDLGLLIIDEEQKFGVGHKEKIKTLKTTVDCLTLTATPIPRTLQFSLMGARDLSIINTPPPNRQPIQTEVLVYNEDHIRDAIYFESERGGQVFFIFNRVQGLSEMATILRGLCPDLNIGIAHGQMEGHELEKHILDFINRKYDVLVCTNIVESGVDIPNVNTIIINNAHHFGLSDLHQLRGRVGRSNKKAFCYLLSPPVSSLPADARKRLITLEQHSDLGSGFQIAMRDLDIRGAGNLLGGEQSGFMAEIGFEMYQKILDEAIRELKRGEFRELFREEISKQDDYVKDCTIDTDQEILIPDAYVENITERLSLYQRLDSCDTDDELLAMQEELADRFGPVPPEVNDLFTTVQCRKLAVDLGFEKMVLKDEILRCYFVGKPDSPYFESPVFQRILSYIQTRTNAARLKHKGRLFSMIVDPVKNMEELLVFLQRLHEFCLISQNETVS